MAEFTQEDLKKAQDFFTMLGIDQEIKIDSENSHHDTMCFLGFLAMQEGAYVRLYEVKDKYSWAWGPDQCEVDLGLFTFPLMLKKIALCYSEDQINNTLQELYAPPEEPEEFFNEYGDPDAIACANGDYNTLEENMVFMDRENDDY